MIRSQQWTFILGVFALVMLGGVVLLQAQIDHASQYGDLSLMTHQLLTHQAETMSSLRIWGALELFGVLSALFLLWPAFGLVDRRDVVSWPWGGLGLSALLALALLPSIGGILFGGGGIALVLRHSHGAGKKVAPRPREWNLALAIFALVGLAGLWLSADFLRTLLGDGSYFEGKLAFRTPWTDGHTQKTWVTALIEAAVRLEVFFVGLGGVDRLLHRGKGTALKCARSSFSLAFLLGLFGFALYSYIAVAALPLLLYVMVLLRQGEKRWQGSSKHVHRSASPLSRGAGRA